MPQQQTGLDISDERLIIKTLATGNAEREFAADVRTGLTATSKHLSPKYFYDDLGSRLFDAICCLPEYYLTRAENEIISNYGDEIVSAVPGRKTLLEMGSGSAQKTKLIVEALLRKQRTLTYIPVDISASALVTSSRVLLQSYPEMRIEAYAGDYYHAIEALENSDRGRTFALFLGSNIGNFEPAEAARFLSSFRRVLKDGDSLLLGADLKKDRQVLEDAYDDALGVTAAFNLNLLVRINREFDADFVVRNFRHIATYNEDAGRIEVYIESIRNQRVTIRALDITVEIAEGERIHTEHSHKYDLRQLSALAAEAGFHRSRSWFDTHEKFSSNLLLAV